MVTQVGYHELFDLLEQMADCMEKWDMGGGAPGAFPGLEDEINSIRRKVVDEWFPEGGALLLSDGIERVTVAIERGVVLCNNRVINLKADPYESDCFGEWRSALSAE